MVRMEAGREYRIAPTTTDCRITITQGNTISECNIDCEPVYDTMNGVYRPLLTVTDKYGKKLRLDEDYDIIYWNNEGDGVMFGAAVGMGEFTGMKPFCAEIGNSPIQPVAKAGALSFNISTGMEFPLYKDYEYHFDLEDDSYVSFTSSAELPPRFDLYRSDYTCIGTLFCEENSEPIFLESGSYIIVYNGGDDYGYEDLPAVSSLCVALECDTKNISGAMITVKDADYTGSAIKPEVEATFNGEELVEGVDFVVVMDEAAIEPGYYMIKIVGINDYSGEVHCLFIIFDEEGEIIRPSYPENHDPIVLTDGKNTITTDGVPEDRDIRWTPTADRYRVTIPSYRLVRVVISDEYGSLIADGMVNMKSDMLIDVEPGREYRVSFIPEVADTYELCLISDGIFSDCTYTRTKNIILDKDTIPEVEFYDAKNDHTLVEGVDYELLCSGYFDRVGRHEYVYRGIGVYSGELMVPFTAYTEEMPEVIEYCELSVGYSSVAGGYYTTNFGEMNFYKFTSEHEGLTKYILSGNGNDGEPIEYITILAYDEDGNFIGADEDVTEFTLAEGETIRFVIVKPTYVGVLDGHSSKALDDLVCSIRVDYAGVGAEPTVTTTLSTEDVSSETTTTAAPVTTDKTTDTTATATDSGSQTTTTASQGTTTDKDITAGTTTTASPEAGGAASTAPEGELPDTGTSPWHEVIVSIAAFMTVMGIAIIGGSKKKRTE